MTRQRHEAGAGRIVGVDVARGLAVLGMMGPHTAPIAPFDWGHPASWLDIVNGRPSILFALLAGVSIGLLSGGIRAHEGVPLVQARMRILVRAVVIFALGGLLSMLGTPVAVVLEFYAVLFVLLLPFLRWSPQRLLLLAGVLALACPVVVTVATNALLLSGRGSTISYLAVTGYFPAVLWIVFPLVGLALARCDLNSARTRLVTLVTGAALAALGYSVGVLVDAQVPGEPGPRYPLTVPAADRVFDLGELATAAAHSGSPFEVVGSTGFALAVVAIACYVADLAPLATHPLAATGSMALSVYTAHIVALAILGATEDTKHVAVYAAFVAVALLASTLWARVLGRGPLERGLTRLSHRAATASTGTRRWNGPYNGVTPNA